jgi:hypothetical protein
MESRCGVSGTVEGGVFFTESDVAGARQLGSVNVEISRQNSNLSEVKAELAAQVRARGGNALVRFKYGQRAHPWWQMLALKWDSESWHGEGLAVLLPAEKPTAR